MSQAIGEAKKQVKRYTTIRAPLDISSSTVQTQDYKSGLPVALLIAPYISVTILTAGDDAVALRSPIDTSYKLIVLRK